MAADLLLAGGTVLTMDARAPRVDAVAVHDGRIVAVGDAARAAAGATTRRLDLAGGTLTPGLVDGHCHLYGLGRSLEALDLRGLRSEAEAARVVAAAGATHERDAWIVGRAWDQNLWTPPAMPTRATLDAAAPGRPVALRRVDGHAVWASSAALARAGIGRASEDPPGGRILRDAHGEPTGVLIDTAAEPVLAAIPEPDAPARERAIRVAAAQAVARGLTGVHEMGIDDATIAAYRELAARGELAPRVYAFLSGEGRLDTLATRRPDVDPDGSARFTLRGVKLYADGALGSRGALLLAPYSDEPDNVGLELLGRDAIAHAAQLAAASGWQLGVHAIGDRANRHVLDAYAPLVGRDLRFRVEHAQLIAPEDLPRFAALGVIAAMQPSHEPSDRPWAEARLGAERLARGAYAWKTLLASGARVVGGSDFPIEDAAPLRGLHAAVTRPGRERLSLDEALRLYTTEPAWASFVEGRRGVIAPGAVADFTWLDRELHPDDRLLDVAVVATLIAGELVYD